MDNAQKAIMIGVGLFITIIVIAAVMLITGMGQDMLQSGQQQVSNISSSLQAQLTSDFDGSTVSGAQVISAVKRYYKDETMIIRVKTASSYKDYGKVVGEFDQSSTLEVKAVKDNTAITPIGQLTDSSKNDTYVPNTARYKAELIKIKGSDDVVGLSFERK